MYPRQVTGAELHRLGKRLIDLSRDATTSAGGAGLTAAEVAVLEYALTNPGCTVTELRDRTGFTQSHVSTSVARLRDRGLVQTAADPDDGRLTRVRLAPVARRAIQRRAARPADTAIRAAVADARTARHVTHLLAELHAALL
jgi:DNA-binding MarR family transcriptional regulator